MDKKQQKEMLKSALKSAIPAMHTELGKVLDFADKFFDAVSSFNELTPKTQGIVFNTLLAVVTAQHPFVNPNYNKNK